MPAPTAHAPALERLAPGDRTNATLAAGAALFDRHGCAACHGVAGGGKPLAGLAGRYTVDQIDALLRAPPAPMPAPPLDAVQRQALARYLCAANP